MPTQRHRWSAAWAACAAAVLLPTVSHAQPVPQVEITEFGEYVVRRETGVLDPKFRTTGSSSVTVADGIQFVDRTTRIEARLCRRFGFAFMARNLDPVFTTRVTIRMKHPTLVSPGQGAFNESTHEAPVNGSRPGLAGYSFDHSWELQPGTWTFSVLFEGKLLVEKAFQVVMPEDPGSSRPERCSDATS